MCGIAGKTGIPVENIQLITDSLRHRGPEGSGYYADSTLQLFHTRLAIQDLSDAGAQPMQDESKRYVLIYNGEIYNHMALRNKLPEISFRSHSDTETLLHLLIRYGTDILEELNGIFAFAFYDREEQQLILARDRFGVKPLYFRDELPNAFLFASELKTLRLLSSSPLSVRTESMLECLMLQYNLTETSGFREIERLGPGKFITIDMRSQHRQTVNWARPLYTGQYTVQTEADWIDQLDTALQQSMQRQLLSDKPVSFFLSGGVDSSLLAGLTKRLYPGRQLDAYSVQTGAAFVQEGFADDYAHAVSFAQQIQCRLHTVNAQPDLTYDLDRIIYALEELQADPACFFVSDIAARAKDAGQDVLIGGTGADDLFSGYRRHQALYYYNVLDNIPAGLRKVGGALLKMLPAGKVRRLQKLLRLSLAPPNERMLQSFLWINRSEAMNLFSADLREQLTLGTIDTYCAGLLAAIPEEHDPLNQMLQLETHCFLAAHNLNYLDKIGMAHSVEIRVPYLDTELTKLSALLPPQLKMKGSETKYLLKKVASRYVPEHIIERSKTGFGAPIRSWLQEDAAFRENLRGRVMQVCSQWPEYFDRQQVERFYNDTINNRTDGAYTLFALAAIESWLRQFTAN